MKQQVPVVSDDVYIASYVSMLLEASCYGVPVS